MKKTKKEKDSTLKKKNPLEKKTAPKLAKATRPAQKKVSGIPAKAAGQKLSKPVGKAPKAAAEIKKKSLLPKRRAAEQKIPLVSEAARIPEGALRPKGDLPLKPPAPVAPKIAEVTPVAAKPESKPKVKVEPRPEPRPEPKPEARPLPVPEPELKVLQIRLPTTLKDLAIRLQEKPSTLIKILMDMRVMVSINQVLEQQLVETLCKRYRCRVIAVPNEEEQVLAGHEAQDKSKDLLPRPPIVTFMGHVDHGKTSLLDAIRKTKVAEREHGGITQHIGAYRVVLKHGEITFLDTPGHEAFTAMRARGASVTDIVVLVVAADDGIMPQTREAIDHARAAGVDIIVALNKIDKPQADPDRVKKQLAEVDLLAEDWGGKTIIVPVSAKTGKGIDDLLEMILLEAQMLELKANPRRLAKGVVIEARLSQGKGPVARLLVQNGTLRLNDAVIVGPHYARIRAMFNARGQQVDEAGPAFPIEVLGLSGVPQAGEQFFVVQDEKVAREIVQKRQDQERQRQMKTVKRISLEDLHAQIKEGKIKDLKLIVKADVQGSLQAIKDTLHKLNISEIQLNIIHEGVGGINFSDVILAVASNALIVGFNVAADDKAKELIAKEGVDLRTYNIIYELANDIKAAIEGMLEPKVKKTFLGKVEVRKVFNLSRSGTVAGCFVSKGKITRHSPVSVVRNGEMIFEGGVSTLKRFKDDVREVLEGFECGVTLKGFDNLQEGDIIEAYEIEKIARKL